MLPPSSDTPDLNSFSMADELAKVADSTKWARLSDMNDLGKIAELANAIGCSSVEDLLCATAAERGHIVTLRMEAEGGRSNVAQDFGNQQFPGVAGDEAVKPQGVDNFSKIKAGEHLRGFSELLCPRREFRR